MKVPIALIALLPWATVLAAGSESPLSLDEVLRSAERHYPLLAAARQQSSIAEGELLAARGAFDLKLKGGVDANQLGYYKNRVNGFGAEQPLQTWGAEVFSAYKRGSGNFGPWEQDRLTLSSGEWSGGVRLPLLRDRRIDRRRADLSVADAGLDLAGAEIAKQRMDVYEAAAESYWAWVKAGRQAALSEELLKLAAQRVDQLQQTIDAGFAAPIELIENRRALLSRQSQVVQARRALQGAAIDLSLYLRDDSGSPVLVAEDRLGDFPEPDSAAVAVLESDIAEALRRRPEVRAFEAKRRQLAVEFDWARNQTKPAIELSTSYGRDLGDGSITKRGNELKVGIGFELPVQRRKAKGKAAVQAAKLLQLDAQLRFARDAVAADVRDAHSALEATFNAVELARAESEAARQLADAERERFDLGDSTLFVVNLRELAAFEAQVREVSALAGYYSAFANYQAATGALVRP